MMIVTAIEKSSNQVLNCKEGVIIGLQEWKGRTSP